MRGFSGGPFRSAARVPGRGAQVPVAHSGQNGGEEALECRCRVLRGRYRSAGMQWTC